jgi:homoaconitase/3-isopropylmalate dehydratase large subunit
MNYTMNMKQTLCLVLLAFLAMGIGTAEIPDLMGNWISTQNVFLVIVEQNDWIFTGYLTYMMNGTEIVENFAGAVGLDNKTLYIAEFNEGYDFGTMISDDEMEWIYLADGKLGMVAIDKFHRALATTVATKAPATTDRPRTRGGVGFAHSVEKTQSDNPTPLVSGFTRSVRATR